MTTYALSVPNGSGGCGCCSSCPPSTAVLNVVLSGIEVCSLPDPITDVVLNGSYELTYDTSHGYSNVWTNPSFGSWSESGEGTSHEGGTFYLQVNCSDGFFSVAVSAFGSDGTEWYVAFTTPVGDVSRPGTAMINQLSCDGSSAFGGGTATVSIV